VARPSSDQTHLEKPQGFHAEPFAKVLKYRLQHPLPDELEAYALTRLGPVNDRIIEEHLLVCADCRHRLQSDDWIIHAIRTTFPNHDFTHVTEDGPIRVWIKPDGRRWTGGIEGEQLHSRRNAKTAESAIVSVSNAFREMFPGHRCNRDCGASDERNDPLIE
jgi:hypothetical protein